MKIIDDVFVCSEDEDEKEEFYRTCYLLYINFEEEYVETNCGDSYYDYSISFDNIIKLADYIKSTRNKNHENRS